MSDYSDLLNSLKNAAGSAANIARDLAGNAGEKARELAGGAGEKAKAVARIAKLKLDINCAGVARDEAYTEIGRIYFESSDKKNPGELYVRLFDQVMLANAAIERDEAELRELRAALGEPAEDADFSGVVDEAEAAAEPEADIEVEITDETPAEDKSGE